MVVRKLKAAIYKCVLAHSLCNAVALNANAFVKAEIDRSMRRCHPTSRVAKSERRPRRKELRRKCTLTMCKEAISTATYLLRLDEDSYPPQETSAQKDVLRPCSCFKRVRYRS